MQHSQRLAPPPASRLKSRLGIWMPLGLWRIDWYYIKSYVKTLVIILAALAALIAISDLFQRFDDFISLARREDRDLQTMIRLFFTYFAAFVPQLIFQHLLPVAMLLAASIAATSSFAGPRGNNEYIVMRSVGVPVLRSFFPLIVPAFLLAVAFQAGRDYFLPGMVRDSSAILNRLRNRTTNPLSVAIIGENGYQTASIGYFAPGSLAHNMILEVRDPETFHRGRNDLGDNDFAAYRAALARLDPSESGGYQWVPLEKGEAHVYTRYARRSVTWTDPIATDLTPAMIERQSLGDAVSSWRDLLVLRHENSGARFELNWRLSDPVACALLIAWGVGLCMRRMLRGKPPSQIQSIIVSMLAAGVFSLIRLAGKSAWEAGLASPEQAVWVPLAVIAVMIFPMALTLEKP